MKLKAQMFKLAQQPFFWVYAVMCHFFKRFTFWKMIGLSIALLAWAGDSFFGWQSNIGYYFLGAIASWCVSENGI